MNLLQTAILVGLFLVTWDYDLTVPTLAGFKIYCTQRDTGAQDVIVIPEKTLQAIAEINLELGKVYDFTLTAYSDTGMESEHSAPISIVDLDKPAIKTVKKRKGQGE